MSSLFVCLTVCDPSLRICWWQAITFLQTLVQPEEEPFLAMVAVGINTLSYQMRVWAESIAPAFKPRLAVLLVRAAAIPSAPP